MHSIVRTPPKFPRNSRRSRYFRTIACVLVFLMAGCARKKPGAKPDTVRQRIVSLHSSITETLVDLGAGGDIVGVDSSSTYPEAIKARPNVGYQRTLSAEGILGLDPTLVIALSEAGPPTTFDQIGAAGISVRIVPSEPTIDGAKGKIQAITKAIGAPEQRQQALIKKIDDALDEARQLLASSTRRPRVLAVYARGPSSIMVFGRDTGADTMIKLAGGINAAATLSGTKPLSSEGAIEAAPDIIVMPTHGLEMIGGESNLWALPGLSMTPAGKQHAVVCIDDSELLGFGPRTGLGVLHLLHKLHPELPGEKP